MSGDVGLSISAILVLNLNFQWGMLQSAELENLMTSVERIFEYQDINPEAALESGKKIQKSSINIKHLNNYTAKGYSVKLSGMNDLY